jgi:hypothetical protein
MKEPNNQVRRRASSGEIERQTQPREDAPYRWKVFGVGYPKGRRAAHVVQVRTGREALSAGG